jgi:hypothetical protein
MKHIAIIHYAEEAMAIGLGDTEDEAAANAVEAYGGPEHLRHEIAIYDLVDGMRLLLHQDSHEPIEEQGSLLGGGPCCRKWNAVSKASESSRPPSATI